ncbi:MAG: GNAT family N-acetyltransferase [Alkaliphilus sp.]
MKHIREGIINKRINGSREPMKYKLSFIGKEYLQEIIELQERVSEGLDNEEIFVGDGREFIQNEVLTQGKGVAMGVFVDGRLVAFRTITFPLADSVHNLGREIGLCGNELNKVAVLEATVVHADYRGNQLQKKMLKYSISLIKERGYRYICATVSPYNYPSLSSVMSFNLTIRDLQIRGGIYGGRLRFLLVRDLREEINKDYKKTISVFNAEIDKQSQLLKEGFIGFEISKKAEKYEIKYGK